MESGRLGHSSSLLPFTTTHRRFQWHRLGCKPRCPATIASQSPSRLCSGRQRQFRCTKETLAKASVPGRDLDMFSYDQGLPSRDLAVKGSSQSPADSPDKQSIVEGSAASAICSDQQLQGDSNPTGHSNSNGNGSTGSAGTKTVEAEGDITQERSKSEQQASASSAAPAFTAALTQLFKQTLGRIFAAFAKVIDAFSRVVRDIPFFARSIQLRRLRTELEENPKDPARLAALVKAHNRCGKRGNSLEVIKLWEEGNFAVDDSCAVEYLKALVFTGRISSYTASAVLKEGERQSSMAEFLRQCQARLEGGQSPGSPGGSSLRPLHVVLQGASVQQPQPRTSFLGSLLRGILSFMLSYMLTFSLISLLLMMGWAAMRRYSPSIGNPAASASTSMAAPTTPSFAPKEYNKETLPEKSVKTFADVRGCDEAKAEVEEVVQFLKHPDRFTRLGGKLPKGVLLTGPPGTGKTLLAKAIAGEAGVPFFFRAGSEFEEMFVGVGSRRVRNLFAAAKKASPCIVFIDEIDAVGQARGTSLESGSSKTLNQLLVEMDGFETNEGVVVIAATNLEKKLDPALTRPGRFDREVAVPLPDVRGRLDIIHYYLQDKPLADDVNAEVLARRTPGFSGAELNNLINEAALAAAKGNKDSISGQHLDEARDKILMGSPRASMVQTAEARRLTAYHESGHALVALNTPGATPIHKATIVPRGHALGMVSMVPHQDEYSITKQQMTAAIDVSMGGRVAEELIFGADQVTSGATSDLKHATQQARHMIMECGMSNEIGPVYVPDEKSAETRKAIDSEVTRMLRDAYTRVTSMLAEKQSDLHKLARALLDHETLTATEIEQVLDGTFDRKPVASSVAQSDVEALLGHGSVHAEPNQQGSGSPQEATQV